MASPHSKGSGLWIELVVAPGDFPKCFFLYDSLPPPRLMQVRRRGERAEEWGFVGSGKDCIQSQTPSVFKSEESSAERSLCNFKVISGNEG